ncbi:MAG: hypothetical protein F9K27_15510 [Anaerolineae bacterium]|nr:MAG: hypothetical protein F9K27_15510 [Anaerolineae bacterium]
MQSRPLAQQYMARLAASQRRSAPTTPRPEISLFRFCPVNGARVSQLKRWLAARGQVGATRSAPFTDVSLLTRSDTHPARYTAAGHCNSPKLVCRRLHQSF